MALGKQAILKHVGLPDRREVHVPAWRDADGDDVVIVRGLTLREYELTSSRAEAGLGTASVLSRCILDPSGGRVFEDDDVQQIAELPLKDIQALDRAVTELSGLDASVSDEGEQLDKGLADAEGNSDATPGAAPSSV